MLYLDSNATSQIAPEVVDAMLPFLRDHHANPSSSYPGAKIVGEAIDTARGQVAERIGAAPDEVVFTSCGTESINTALESALALAPTKNHLIISAVEHAAVIEKCKQLHRERGTEITILPVDEFGLINTNDFAEALRPGETAAVSLIWGNNETGTLTPIEEAAALAHEAGALIHVDAVQTLGKLLIDLSHLHLDYVSFSGHKLHAPKGIGALYVHPRTRFRPLIVGGGQESGRRAGTENTPYIVALGHAAAKMTPESEANVRTLRDTFETALLRDIPGAEINGHPELRLPTTSNLHLPGIDAAAMLILLAEEDIYCSAGSACHTGSIEPSHVLTAMGYSRKRAASSLRFSFSRLNTPAEVTEATTKVTAAAKKMLQIRPPSSGPVKFSS